MRQRQVQHRQPALHRPPPLSKRLVQRKPQGCQELRELTTPSSRFAETLQNRRVRKPTLRQPVARARALTAFTNTRVSADATKSVKLMHSTVMDSLGCGRRARRHPRVWCGKKVVPDRIRSRIGGEATLGRQPSPKSTIDRIFRPTYKKLTRVSFLGNKRAKTAAPHRRSQSRTRR